MSITKLNESSIPNLYTQNSISRSYEWEPVHTAKMFDIFFTGVADFLGLAKSKEQKTAVVVNDLKGNFLMAAIAFFEESDDKTQPGNWDLAITTNPEDIENCKVFIINDPRFLQQLASTSHSLHNIKFNDPSYAVTLMELVAKTLLTWLDQNAKDGEVVSLVYDGYFEASVAIENGQKVFAVTPDGEIKRLIKDDVASSANVA